MSREGDICADAGVRASVAALAKHTVRDDEVLFELRIARVLHTTWENSRQPNARPLYTKWQAPH